MSELPAPGHPALASCLAPRGSATLTLTDTNQAPRLKIEVGDYLVVTVPAWHRGTAADVYVSRTNLLRQLCTVVLPDHGRRTVFKAERTGSSHLSATVEPASNLLMPAWNGVVTIHRASR